LREQRERLDTEAHGQQLQRLQWPTGSSCNDYNRSKRCAALGPHRTRRHSAQVPPCVHRPARLRPGGCTVHAVVHRMPLGTCSPVEGSGTASTDRTECSASQACRSTHSNSPTASRRTCAAHHSCGPTCGSGESRRRCGRVSPENGTEAAESGRDVAAVSAVPWNARRIGWAQTCPTVTTPAEHRPFHSISCYFGRTVSLAVGGGRAIAMRSTGTPAATEMSQSRYSFAPNAPARRGTRGFRRRGRRPHAACGLPACGLRHGAYPRATPRTRSRRRPAGSRGARRAALAAHPPTRRRARPKRLRRHHATASGGSAESEREGPA
jgi:hypothetical protein